MWTARPTPRTSNERDNELTSEQRTPDTLPSGRPQNYDDVSLAAQLAAWKAYHKMIGERIATMTAEVLSGMADGEVKSLEPKDRNGLKIASIVRSSGRTTAGVASESKAVAWAQASYPTEVETITRVRPAFLSALLEAAKKAGVGVDPRTGELLDWITVAEGDPYLSVTTSEEAQQQMRHVIDRITETRALPW